METQLKKVCGISLALEGFTAEWRHCDIVSNYISRAASFNRADAFLYSNLLSTVVNELLEVAFWHHDSGEPLNLDILDSCLRKPLSNWSFRWMKHPEPF